MPRSVTDQLSASEGPRKSALSRATLRGARAEVGCRLGATITKNGALNFLRDSRVYLICVDRACRKRLISASSLRQCQNITPRAPTGTITKITTARNKRPKRRRLVTVPVISSRTGSIGRPLCIGRSNFVKHVVFFFKCDPPENEVPGFQSFDDFLRTDNVTVWERCSGVATLSDHRSCSSPDFGVR